MPWSVSSFIVMSWSVIVAFACLGSPDHFMEWGADVADRRWPSGSERCGPKGNDSITYGGKPISQKCFQHHLIVTFACLCSGRHDQGWCDRQEVKVVPLFMGGNLSASSTILLFMPLFKWPWSVRGWYDRQEVASGSEGGPITYGGNLLASSTIFFLAVATPSKLNTLPTAM